MRSVHSIHSLWKSKRTATYNNLEIRIACSSCCPWLSFIQKQTCMSIYTSLFWVKLINAWDMRFLSCYDRSFWKAPATSAHFQQFSKDFQTLPKKCVKLIVLTTFEKFWSYFKGDKLSVLTPSVKKKLNCIFGINHKNNLSGFVCQVCEIVLVDERNQGLEISPQEWNSCIMC